MTKFSSEVADPERWPSNLASRDLLDRKHLIGISGTRERQVTAFAAPGRESHQSAAGSGLVVSKYLRRVGSPIGRSNDELVQQTLRNS